MKNKSSRSNYCAAHELLLVMITIYGAVAVAEDNIHREVERGMELWHVPGMAVAVVGQDDIRFQQGFGRTSANGGELVDEHTLFAIASTTKAMVVAGLLMLADEEKLQLDDPVIKHIPELHFGDPSLTQQITIRDLLAHRTGLPRTDEWVFLQAMPLDEQIPRLRTIDPMAPVRTRLIYQNTMFELAGLIIERVGGKRWDAFLTERLWHPIGMRETYGARGQIAMGKTHVMPHHYINDELTQAEWDFESDHADAAGSVWSSVHDMSLWAQFLLRGAVTADGEQLISDGSLAEMFEPTQLASPDDFSYLSIELTKPNWRTYGLGWFQQDFQGRKIEFHTGSLSGLIAIIGLDRAQNKAIIALGNRDHAEMRHALLWHVMDNSPAEEKRDWNQEIFDLYEASANEKRERDAENQEGRLSNTNPALPLESYAGTYRNESYDDFVITYSDDKLELDTGRVSFDIAHWHLETFQILKEEIDFQGFVTFGIGVDGTIRNFVFFDGSEFTPLPDESEEAED